MQAFQLPMHPHQQEDLIEGYIKVQSSGRAANLPPDQLIKLPQQELPSKSRLHLRQGSEYSAPGLLQRRCTAKQLG